MVTTGIGGGPGDDLFDRPIHTVHTSHEVQISCNLGDVFEDNYVDLGEDSGEQRTIEMGTSYDPPAVEQDENRAPNATNMLRILE